MSAFVDHTGKKYNKDSPVGRGNNNRRLELEKRDSICSRCPPNGGENKHKWPRSDRYKDKRKGK